MTAPLAAWEALYRAHKDNKRHYGFFQHNSFRERDKLLILYVDKMATGEHARPVGQPKRQPNVDREGESETGDDDISVTSQIRRRREREGDVLEIATDDEDRVEGRVEDSPDSHDTPNRIPTQSQSQPQSKARKSSKKRAAEESLNNGRPKRERSSADKIQAGLESLCARADASNDIKKETLSAKMKLIDHTVKHSLLPHEQAFEMLMTDYKEQVDALSEEDFDALPLLLEEPIRQGNKFSTLGTTKGKHLCMLPPGPRKDAFVARLLGEGIEAFVAEINSAIPGTQDIGLGGAFY